MHCTVSSALAVPRAKKFCIYKQKDDFNMNYYPIKFTSNTQKDYLHLCVSSKICLQSKCVRLFVQREYAADGRRIVIGEVYQHFKRSIIVSA